MVIMEWSKTVVSGIDICSWLFVHSEGLLVSTAVKHTRHWYYRPCFWIAVGLPVAILYGCVSV